MLSARSPEAKAGVNGGKGGPTRSGGAFISTLAPEGAQPPLTCRAQRLRPRRPCKRQRSGAARKPSGRLEAVRITAQDSSGCLAQR